MSTPHRRTITIKLHNISGTNSEALRPAAASSRPLKLVTLAIVALMAMVVATGCGKPQFCADRTALENSVKGLPSAATSSGVSGLEAQLKTVQSDANTLVASAKSDFPTESSAIENSIKQLESSVKGLPTDPSTSQLAGIAINASAVVNSVKSFTAATDKDCK